MKKLIYLIALLSLFDANSSVSGSVWYIGLPIYFSGDVELWKRGNFLNNFQEGHEVMAINIPSPGYSENGVLERYNMTVLDVTSMGNNIEVGEFKREIAKILPKHNNAGEEYSAVDFTILLLNQDQQPIENGNTQIELKNDNIYDNKKAIQSFDYIIGINKIETASGGDSVPLPPIDNQQNDPSNNQLSTNKELSKKELAAYISLTVATICATGWVLYYLKPKKMRTLRGKLKPLPHESKTTHAHAASKPF